MNSPGNELNDRVRSVLEKVPRVSFQLHLGKDDSGLRRCPESFPFPSCLRSSLEYMGDDMGFKTIGVANKEWRLDTAYVFLMGTTGGAFRLSWKPGWHMGNPSFALMSDNPLEPYHRGLNSVGYSYDILQKDDKRFTGRNLRHLIMESIQKKARPVIAHGVVGPPVDCIIAGFDEEGDVLIGWSYFQKTKEFSKDVEFEPSGLAAYEAWASAISLDEEFTDKKVKELHHRYHVHMDASGTIAEGRWYAYQFLQKVMEDVDCPKEEITQAAMCYNAEHALMWQLWELVGGPGASVKKAKMFRDPDIREKSADFILKARDNDEKAIEHLERALENW